MNWLAALIKGLLGAVLDWGQKQAEKPKTIENAETTEKTQRAWHDDMVRRLRDLKNRNSGQPK